MVQELGLQRSPGSSKLFLGCLWVFYFRYTVRGAQGRHSMSLAGIQVSAVKRFPGGMQCVEDIAESPQRLMGIEIKGL